MFLQKNIKVYVFADVLQHAKHRAKDASNAVNRPLLALTSKLDCIKGLLTLESYVYIFPKKN